MLFILNTPLNRTGTQNYIVYYNSIVVADRHSPDFLLIYYFLMIGHGSNNSCSFMSHILFCMTTKS